MEMLKTVGKAILKSVLSEAVMKKLVILLLEWLSKKSTNDLDDKIVAEIKKALEEK